MIVIIKGTIIEAEAAAKRRNITLSKKRMTHHNETLAHVPYEQRAKVWDWFEEEKAYLEAVDYDPSLRQSYPVGTLLWFTYFG